mmetsp:Transcript_17283/g.35507  ORF Transcript_17283/g.35507 Transcript_17283/m.35507 type:complete len:252 (-) Transcript_17283:1869-2624(-)
MRAGHGKITQVLRDGRRRHDRCYRRERGGPRPTTGWQQQFHNHSRGAATKREDENQHPTGAVSGGRALEAHGRIQALATGGAQKQRDHPAEHPGDRQQQHRPPVPVQGAKTRPVEDTGGLRDGRGGRNRRHRIRGKKGGASKTNTCQQARVGDGLVVRRQRWQQQQQETKICHDLREANEFLGFSRKIFVSWFGSRLQERPSRGCALPSKEIHLRDNNDREKQGRLVFRGQPVNRLPPVGLIGVVAKWMDE